MFLLGTSTITAAQSYTGHWKKQSPNESGLWLGTLQKKNIVTFQLELSAGAPSYNSGWIQGEVIITNNVGRFRESTEAGLCEIGFRFHATRVELTQIGDEAGCGFGRNVIASGVLQRTSTEKPRFCTGDPRAGECGDASR